MNIFDFKLGYSCNNRCKHCIIKLNVDFLIGERKHIDRTTEECKAEIKSYVDEQIRLGNHLGKIVLTGGEPTIRKDFLDICHYIAEQDFVKIELQTNGRRFENKEFTKQIMQVCIPIDFTVALHGPNAEAHDDVTGVKGSFQQTVQGIENICCNQGIVHGKIVISKINYPYLTDTVKLFEALGIKSMSVAFPHSAIHDSRFYNYVPTYGDIADELRSILHYAKAQSLALKLECVPFCFVEGYEEFVGELSYLKNVDRYFSPVKLGVRDWNQTRKSIKAKAPQCSQCYLNNFCEGVWEEYIHYYGKEDFQPVTNVRQVALLISKFDVLKQKGVI